MCIKTEEIPKKGITPDSRGYLEAHSQFILRTTVELINASTTGFSNSFFNRWDDNQWMPLMMTEEMYGYSFVTMFTIQCYLKERSLCGLCKMNSDMSIKFGIAIRWITHNCRLWEYVSKYRYGYVDTPRKFKYILYIILLHKLCYYLRMYLKSNGISEEGKFLPPSM